MLLKTRALAWTDVQRRVLQPLAAGGIARERIELLPATATRREHLETYARVDVALDTFPYAGATTTLEALYMGVPVITLAGDRHAARLGVSILSALGLSDWITRDRAEYIARALRASGERAQLQALRATLRARLQGSPLCDGRRVARAIEAAALAYFGRWARDHA